MSYTQEERARSRSTVRRLQALAVEARKSASRGIILPDATEQAIFGLTQTNDRNAQINALHLLSERLRSDHLAKLRPYASDEFNAFCEYVNPDEPPESPWHIFLTNTLQSIETEPGNERFVLNCPPGHAKPLATDTLVLMGDGSWKRLGDIEVGDMVITHLGRARRVTEVHEQGVLDVLKIKTKLGREITAAPDHSFCIRERHAARMSPAMFRQADDLRVGNLLQMVAADPIANHSGKRNRDFELAALIAAQGSRNYQWNRQKTKQYRNVFLIAKDADLVVKMRRVLNGLKIRHTCWLASTDKLHYIRINSRSGDRLARIYDLDKLATQRRIPEFIFKGGDKEVQHYIETYVNLRGEVPTKFKLPRLHVTFKSYEMALDFQRLLSRFGVPAAVRNRKANGAVLSMTHDQLSFYLNRFKYDGVHKDRLAKNIVLQLQDRRFRGPFYNVDPIRSIVQNGKATCRCLTVEDDHTFVANGVVVHNSTYASRLFVAWRLGRRPAEKIIGGGHSQRFVENEFSKKIRSLVSGQAYHEIFPKVVVDHSTRAADQWAIAGFGGQYVARGVGQAVHGFRANFACIDDPYSKVEDAESATIREKVKTWFFNDIDSRLLPGAAVFLIMTRFHEDDLTGAVMEANKELLPHMQFRIVEAPAICYDPDNDPLNRKVGDVLWDYYSLDYFRAKRAVWNYQRFSLVFQQLTSATDENSVASHFQFYRIAPHATPEAVQRAKEQKQVDPVTHRPMPDKREYYRRIVASVDTATKETQRADYTVIQIWAETFDRKHYLLDQKRGKWALPDMTREINKLARYHGVDAILIEDKGNGSAYIQDQGSTEFQRRKAPAPVVAIQVPSNQGKSFRFDEVTPMIEAHEVFLPQNVEWIDLFIREVGQFPGGAKDDQVDALSQYLRWVKSKRSRYGSKKIGSMG